MKLERGDYQKILDDAKNMHKDATTTMLVSTAIMEMAEKSMLELPPEKKKEENTTSTK